MNKTRTRQITPIILVVLGIVIFVTYFIHLILLKFSLPPWSFQTEGKYVAFSLEVWGFLWLIPVSISLFLLAYLIHPSKFERFSKMLKALFIIFAIGGFGLTALLMGSAIINSSPAASYVPILILKSIAGLSPFWMMGILAICTFKKVSKPYSIRY